MRKALLLLLVLTGCPSPNPHPTDGGVDDAGLPPPPQGVSVIDSRVTERLPLSMAVGPNDRVGIAWFVRLGDSTKVVPGNDAGFIPGTVSDYALLYAEWKNGNVSATQQVDVVQRPFGMSLAFQLNGEPAIAYLGGGSDDSIYWFQSDAVIAYRSGGVDWTKQTAVQTGDQAIAGNPVSDRGLLVGLNPGLAFNGSGAWLAYRDGHAGQFPQQDWAGSDLELAQGGPTSFTHSVLQAGGNDKQAWGGHIQMVMANGQPAVVSDQVFGSADGTGMNVNFHRFDGSSWHFKQVATPYNTQSGPALAFQTGQGFGIAYLNKNTDALFFTSSADGNSWTTPDTVFQNGTGGWYPSVAFDPSNNAPTVAFYICSAETGIADGNCQTSQDSLVISMRQESGDWAETTIDNEGGYLPKISFLSTQKRVVAYRHPRTYQVRLYVEP